ncbi:MAG: PqqD family protein [Bradymonadaceae bacterium]
MGELIELEGEGFAARDRFSLREDLVVEEVDDEFLILDLNHNTYFGLNGVGRRIWEGMAAEKTFEEIVDWICEDYEVAREEASADVRDFIAEVLDQKLARRLARPKP